MSSLIVSNAILEYYDAGYGINLMLSPWMVKSSAEELCAGKANIFVHCYSMTGILQESATVHF